MLKNRPHIMFDTDPDSSTGGTATPQGNAAPDGGTPLQMPPSPGAGQQLTPDQWQARVSGLQSTLDKQKAVTEATLADLRSKLDTANTRLGELTQEHGSLSNNHTQTAEQLKIAQEQAAKLTGETEALKAANARHLFIMEKYPQLASFEASGLLPTATTNEELAGKLEAFSAAIGTMVKQNVDQKLSGSSPASPPGNSNGGAPTDAIATLSDDDLYFKLMAKDVATSPEYEKLLAEWGKRSTPVKTP